MFMVFSVKGVLRKFLSPLWAVVRFHGPSFSLLLVCYTNARFGWSFSKFELSSCTSSFYSHLDLKSFTVVPFNSSPI